MGGCICKSSGWVSRSQTVPLAQVVSRVSTACHHFAEACHAAWDAAAHASRSHARVVAPARRVDHVDVDRVAPALDGRARRRAEHVHVHAAEDRPLRRELVELRRERSPSLREEVRRGSMPPNLSPPEVVGEYEQDVRFGRRRRCCERRRRRQLGQEGTRWLQHGFSPARYLPFSDCVWDFFFVAALLIVSFLKRLLAPGDRRIPPPLQHHTAVSLTGDAR